MDSIDTLPEIRPVRVFCTQSAGQRSSQRFPLPLALGVGRTLWAKPRPMTRVRDRGLPCSEPEIEGVCAHQKAWMYCHQRTRARSRACRRSTELRYLVGWGVREKTAPARPERATPLPWSLDQHPAFVRNLRPTTDLSIYVRCECLGLSKTQVSTRVLVARSVTYLAIHHGDGSIGL